MAKELPFFKFEVSEWAFGRIQKQPLATQGVFINLCCKYWHKLGELTWEDACLDFGDDHIIALEKHKIIGKDGDFIFIKFLDKQFDECQETSSKNRIAGFASAAARAKRKLTPVQHPLESVERNSTEEKRREENRREEKREEKTREWFEGCLDDIFKETLAITHKGKNVNQAISEAWVYLSADKNRLRAADSSDVKKLVNTWLGNMKGEKQEQKRVKLL